jgi:hypothetical protein
MRVLGMLVLLVVALGFGIALQPASAEPCPMHAHHRVMAGQETEGTGSTMLLAVPAETVAIAAPAHPDAAPASHPVPDHAVPEGQSCCHVAATAVPAAWPALEPRASSGRRPVPRSWLPPWATPSDGIFRPPASA